ncbi:MAG: hypothetical protein GX551_03275, partial [Clostridiaceae bacterium]|nr:hypothetical protein [Clostridiaceae bacterium]
MNDCKNELNLDSWRTAAARTVSMMSGLLHLPEAEDDPGATPAMPSEMMSLNHYKAQGDALNVTSEDELKLKLEPIFEEDVTKSPFEEEAEELDTDFSDGEEETLDDSLYEKEEEDLDDEDEDEVDEEMLLERIGDIDIDLAVIYPLIHHGKDNDNELEQQD